MQDRLFQVSTGAAIKLKPELSRIEKRWPEGGDHCHRPASAGASFTAGSGCQDAVSPGCSSWPQFGSGRAAAGSTGSETGEGKQGQNQGQGRRGKARSGSSGQNGAGAGEGSGQQGEGGDSPGSGTGSGAVKAHKAAPAAAGAGRRQRQRRFVRQQFHFIPGDRQVNLVEPERRISPGRSAEV